MAAPLTDAVGAAAGSSSSHTVALTIAASSSRVLCAFVGDPAQNGVSAITWNTSEVPALLASGTYNAAGDNWYLYRLIAPTAATANLVVTYGGTSNHTLLIASFYDCDQTTPDDGADEAEGSGTAMQNTVASATGDLAVAFGVSTGTSTFAPASGESEIIDSAVAGAAYTLAGAATVSFDITLGTSRPWVCVGLNLNAVAAAADPPPGTRMRNYLQQPAMALPLIRQGANLLTTLLVAPPGRSQQPLPATVRLPGLIPSPANLSTTTLLVVVADPPPPGTRVQPFPSRPVVIYPAITPSAPSSAALYGVVPSWSTPPIFRALDLSRPPLSQGSIIALLDQRPSSWGSSSQRAPVIVIGLPQPGGNLAILFLVIETHGFGLIPVMPRGLDVPGPRFRATGSRQELSRVMPPRFLPSQPRRLR